MTIKWSTFFNKNRWSEYSELFILFLFKDQLMTSKRRSNSYPSPECDNCKQVSCDSIINERQAKQLIEQV